MPATTFPLPRRARLLPMLAAAHRERGYLDPETVEGIARELRIPAAEAWEAATSQHEFRFEPGLPARGCAGVACAIQPGWREPTLPAGCLFTCFAPPASGDERPFPPDMVRRAGPLLASWECGWAGFERARSLGPQAALEELAASGLRGRGGAYFPAAAKWRAALRHGAPLALVMNGEEGEPGVFKDRALLCLRPERVVEGLAIAMEVLRPAVTIAFINGSADPAAEAFERALADSPVAGQVLVYRGAGGYVLGEETVLLNAIEGRRAVPRPRPPLPVDAGLFGMPTVVNNVETFASVSVIFRQGAAAFRSFGTSEAPGTRLLSLSGRVARPGIYEVALGTRLSDVLEEAGAPPAERTALLCGGPSGGFLPAAMADVATLPGRYHPTGAMLGAGGVVVLEAPGDIRRAALTMAAFNAEQSCGKCTPCREGAPLLFEQLSAGETSDIDELAEVVQAASLCGLGQMATGPVRSALAFWPEVFR
ncbi:NADH-ubiquinone oxidoreductase-F iron-sulfur binding region domain-containing protein [Tepidiforma sp.]|jgi:NADH:ubiquinone oxidoreductase subunit F (NADH-binding)|uniref:NADH-ubiquinone oxidoreductase-F iron-sulfur binding region domain-containing protein n=1 Tax=Tepidiforma sp. TaxID=2682230 RepID=UPI0026100A79|nr:NADH-ubiquinone oxidoreductase-F iron-sulfur binding region domain-containing protein [Tepidiforma sp.]MCX7616849.1 SLBB domain-containing protein [Tepidiforma sp.]